jgi:hypothetical protein
VADGGIVRMLGRMIADDLRRDAVPERGEVAELGVCWERTELVDEALARLQSSDVRDERPHLAQRLIPLTRLEELGLGQLGALDDVHGDAGARGRVIGVVAIARPPRRGATEACRLLFAALDASDSGFW